MSVVRLGVRIPAYHEKTDDRGKVYVAYELLVTYGAKEWRATIRYSHVFAFHEQVKRRYPTLAMGKMPPKKVLGAQKRAFLDRRRYDLEQFLQLALSYESVRHDASLLALLELHEPIETVSVSATSAGPGEMPSAPMRSDVQTIAPPPALVVPTASPTSMAETAVVTFESARVLYAFEANESDKLALAEGDFVLVYERDDSGWWYGESSGRVGYFPADYVEIVNEDNDDEDDHETHDDSVGILGMQKTGEDPKRAGNPRPEEETEDEEDEEEEEAEEGEEDDRPSAELSAPSTSSTYSTSSSAPPEPPTKKGLLDEEPPKEKFEANSGRPSPKPSESHEESPASAVRPMPPAGVGRSAVSRGAPRRMPPNGGGSSPALGAGQAPGTLRRMPTGAVALPFALALRGTSGEEKAPVLQPQEVLSKQEERRQFRKSLSRQAPQRPLPLAEPAPATVRPPPVASRTLQREAKTHRDRIIGEILSTERSYVESLRLLAQYRTALSAYLPDPVHGGLATVPQGPPSSQQSSTTSPSSPLGDSSTHLTLFSGLSSSSPSGGASSLGSQSGGKLEGTIGNSTSGNSTSGNLTSGNSTSGNYAIPMGWITTEKLKSLFSNSDSILKMNEQLYEELRQRMEGPDFGPNSTLCDVFIRWAPFLRMYTEYGNNYETSTQMYVALLQHSGVASLLDEVKAQCGQQTLESLLIMPIQRIPRYRLLLEDLQRHTSESHADYGNLVKAVHDIRAIGDHVNESIRNSEASRNALTILSILGPGFQHLVAAHRKLLRSTSSFTQARKSGRHHVLLFNDILVVAKVKDAKKKTVIPYELPVRLLWLAGPTPEKGGKASFRVTCPEESFVFLGAAKEVDDFVEALSSVVLDAIRPHGGQLEAGAREGSYTYPGRKDQIPGRYEGSYVDGKRNGSGRFTYRVTGAVYDGQWRDDGRCGHGRLTFATGESIECEWVHNQPSGEGVYRYVDGTLFHGTLREGGREDGPGKLSWPEGDVFEGRFVNGLAQGRGTLTCADGTRFVGMYKDNVRCGPGLLTRPDGSRYEGGWANNRREGSGVLTTAYGESYDGDWLDDRREGKGSQTYADRSVYVGDWVHDRREGKGRLRSPAGDVYEGSWKDDRRHGLGCYTCTSFRYDGEWLADRRSGRGTLSFFGGAVLEGSFVDDLPSGTCSVSYPCGSTLEGRIVAGERDGRCVVRFALQDSEEIEGRWKDCLLSLNSKSASLELPLLIPRIDRFR